MCIRAPRSSDYGCVHVVTSGDASGPPTALISACSARPSAPAGHFELRPKPSERHQHHVRPVPLG
eukprot:9324917-Alexandrium_andersonii.AAC.1